MTLCSEHETWTAVLKAIQIFSLASKPAGKMTRRTDLKCEEEFFHWRAPRINQYICHIQSHAPDLTTRSTSPHALPKHLHDHTAPVLTTHFPRHPLLTLPPLGTTEIPTHASHAAKHKNHKKKKKKRCTLFFLHSFEPVGVARHACNHATEGNVAGKGGSSTALKKYVHANLCPPHSRPGQYRWRGVRRQREVRWLHREVQLHAQGFPAAQLEVRWMAPSYFDFPSKNVALQGT